MKRYITLFAIFGAATANAAVSVNWLSPSNSIKQQDGTTNAPRSWMAQLIWSPDSAASPLDPANPFVPTGGEVVVNSRAMGTSIDGRIIVGKISFADSLAGGFVYTRVFNVDFNGGSPVTPNLFGNSAVITGGLVVETADPSTIAQHWASPLGPQLIVNQEVGVVPEPQTYALMLMGLGGLLLARRKRAH